MNAGGDRGTPRGGTRTAPIGVLLDPGDGEAGRQPANPVEGMVEAIVGFAADGASRVVKPEVAATVATTFGFPLALTVLVLLFLVIQPRLDDRDPKLRAAPHQPSDTLVAFEDDLS